MLASVAPQSARSFAFVPTAHRHAAMRPRAIAFHAAGTEIYAQGDETDTIHRVEYGAVRIYRLLSDGRRQIVAFHMAGETFGFEPDTQRRFYAEALVDTGLKTVEIDADGRFSADLLALALRNMARAQDHLLVIGRQSALEKLAVFLLDLDARQSGNGVIDLPMTRADIGDYLGMTIETVSRSLSRLRANGCIRLKGARSIELLKRDTLRQLCA